MFDYVKYCFFASFSTDCVVLQVKSMSELKKGAVLAMNSVDADSNSTPLHSENHDLDAVLTELLSKVKDAALAAKKLSTNTTCDDA